MENYNHKREIVLLGNGTRLEVSFWSKDKSYLSGRILDLTPEITVYVPATYLDSSGTKSNKRNK